MASIRKRNNRWEARVRRRGYPTQTKTFTHKTSAQLWAKETELDLETAHLKSVHFAKSPTLAVAVERYLSETIARPTVLIVGMDNYAQHCPDLCSSRA